MAAAMATDESPLDEPFSYLPYNTVNEIYMNITVESARRKMDWRALAGALGFNEKQVTLMQQDMRRPCKGKLLIDVWEDLGNSSLRKLIYALKMANMGECLNIIKQDLYLEDVDFPSVLDDYEQLKETKMLRREFPRIPMTKFSEAFYHTPRPDSPPIWAPNPIVDVNAKAPSSLEMNRQDDQILDARSVYISYCPESALTNHKFNSHLRKFAEFIQNQGFTLHFEPHCRSQIQRCYGDVALWKEACIKKSKNIVVLCTPEYFKEDSKVINDSRRSVSKLDVDGRLLRQIAYSKQNGRIIPVVLDCKKPTKTEVPFWLSPLLTHSWPSGQEKLVLCLDDQPRYKLPKVDPKKRIVIKPIVIDFPSHRKHKCT